MKNPPVFPRIKHIVASRFPNVQDVECSEGMTLRDYFASAALTGMWADSSPASVGTYDQIAKYAYQQADAMLKAREK